MVNLIALNLIVVASAMVIVRRFFIFEHTYDYFITLFIIFLAQVVLSTQLLGMCGALYLHNLYFLNGLILIVVCLFTCKTNIGRKDGFVVRFQDTIANLDLEFTERMLLALIFGFALVKIIINLKNPPFGWDSLSYHFTFPVEWIKNHNLDNPIVAFCDPSPSYYPINGSLFYFWFMLPLKNVFIADLGQFPFFVLAFMALYALARKINLSRKYAMFSAAIFTLVPNYFKQMEIAYVDVMVCALFLSALNYIFLLKKDARLPNVYLACIAIGLMIGVKTTALPFSLLLIILLAYFWITRFKKRLIAVIPGVFLIIVTGGFTYIRNFIQTGNFLYPLNLNLFGVSFFKGVIDTTVYRTAVMPRDYSWIKILFSEGLGAQAVLFMLPAVFLGLWLILKKGRKYSFDMLYLLLLPILMILVYRFVVPLPNLRYIYALMGICAVIAFFAAQELHIEQRFIKTLVIISAIASVFEISKHWLILISLLVSTFLFLIMPAVRNFLIRLKASHIVVSAVILFFALFLMENDYVEHEYERYISTVKMSGFWPDATRAWEWLNRNTQASNIAYAGRPVPFPLYGSGFKNNVYYVSVNKEEPAKLHHFLNSKYIWDASGESKHISFEQDSNYRGKADYNIWEENLRSRKTEYLFVYSLHHAAQINFPMEDLWAAAHPDKFRLVFSNGIVHIYKLLI